LSQCLEVHKVWQWSAHRRPIRPSTGWDDPEFDGLGRPGVRWVGTTQSSMGWDDPACGIDRLVTASQKALQTCSEMQIPISIPSVENRRNAKHQISTRTTTVIQGNTGPNAPNVNIAIPWVDLTSDCAIRYPRIANPANTGNVYTSAGMKCEIANSRPHQLHPHQA